MKYYIIGCDQCGEYFVGYCDSREEARAWIEGTDDPSDYRIIASNVTPSI